MRKFTLLLALSMANPNAMTVERSLSTDGQRAALRILHQGSGEPVAALRIRIFLRPGAMGEPLSLGPGGEKVWSQVTPELLRSGDQLEVLALAPNHTGLSSTYLSAIFRLELAAAGGRHPVDSVQILEALDFRGAALTPALRDSLAEDFTASVRTGATEVTFRRTDRLHFIGFLLDRPQPVRARVLDTRGRVLRTLAQARFPAGVHRIPWDGRDGSGSTAAPGSYVLELRIGKSTHHQSVRHVP